MGKYERTERVERNGRKIITIKTKRRTVTQDVSQRSNKGLVSCDNVSTQKAANRFWLVKIPPQLRYFLNTVPDDCEFGTLTIHDEELTDGNPKIEIEINPPKTLENYEDFEMLEGSKFDFNYNPGEPLYIFEKEEEKVSVAGKVEYNCHMVAKDKTKAMKQIQKSTEYSNRNRYELKSIEFPRQVEMMKRAEGLTQTKPKETRLEKIQKQREKSVRRDRDVVISELFEYFTKNENATFAELKEATKQPDKSLKDILNDIADYQRGGENRGKYKLKDSLKLEEKSEAWE